MDFAGRSRRSRFDHRGGHGYRLDRDAVSAFQEGAMKVRLLPPLTRGAPWRIEPIEERPSAFTYGQLAVICGLGLVLWTIIALAIACVWPL